MNRAAASSRCLYACVPHARGDEPVHGVAEIKHLKCSPRTWG